MSMGILWERVREMDRKLSKMEKQIDHLVALVNRGKGGLWFGMTVIAVLSSLAGFMGAIFKGHS